MVGRGWQEARQSHAHSIAAAARDSGRRTRHIGAVGGVQTVVKRHRRGAAIGVHRAVQDCRSAGDRSRRERCRCRDWRGRQAQTVHGTLTTGNQHEFFACPELTGVHGHRHIALCRAVNAQLTINIVTPCDDGPIGALHQAVVSACSHSNHRFSSQSAAGDHRHGHSALRRAVVAQLAGGIVAPGGDGSIRAQGHAMVLSSSHGDDSLACKGRARGGHCDRNIALCGAVVAQLPVLVPTPGHQGTIGAQRDVVKAASRHGNDRFARQRRACCRHRHRHNVIGRRAIAQLTVTIVTPRSHGAVRAERQAVSGP